MICGFIVETIVIVLVSLIYRIRVTMPSWLALLARSSASKDAEILALRQGVAILRRTNPKPKTTWPDRAVLAALARKLLGALVTVAQRDISKDVEVLVLRHENAVLRRHVEKVRYQPEDRLWFAALSCLIPRRRWAEVFPVTPGTVLAWHRNLVAGKYTTAPTRPGRPSIAVPVKALVIRMATDNDETP